MDHGHVDIIDGCIWQWCQMSSSVDGWWLVEFTCVDEVWDFAIMGGKPNLMKYPANNKSPAKMWQSCTFEFHLNNESMCEKHGSSQQWKHVRETWVKSLVVWWHYRSKLVPVESALQLSRCSALHCQALPNLGKRWGRHLTSENPGTWHLKSHEGSCSTLRGCKKRENVMISLVNNSDHHGCPAKMCASTKLGNRAHQTAQHHPACTGQNPPPPPPQTTPTPPPPN